VHDYHPLLCPPEEKAEREGANGLDQIQYISELILSGVSEIRESHVRELHRLAVNGIYPCGGSFRTIAVSITNSEHQPPHHPLVRAMVADALDWINGSRGTKPALERASYALWRFNWIHPFAGGNGRTSRALAYLIICADEHAMLPGRPNMPTRIYERRTDYIKALRAADASEKLDGADFSEMINFLEDVLMQQMADLIDKLGKSRPSA
jgi:Fic family protein